MNNIVLIKDLVKFDLKKYKSLFNPQSKTQSVQENVENELESSFEEKIILDLDKIPSIQDISMVSIILVFLGGINSQNDIYMIFPNEMPQNPEDKCFIDNCQNYAQYIYNTVLYLKRQQISFPFSDMNLLFKSLEEIGITIIQDNKSVLYRNIKDAFMSLLDNKILIVLAPSNNFWVKSEKNIINEDKNIIIENNSNKDVQSNISENNLNNDERKKLETEIDFLDYELNVMENQKIVKNIFNNINQNNIDNIQLILEVENEKLKKENNNNNKQLKDEIEKVNRLEMNYKNEINMLNETIIQLKSNLEKIKQENKILNDKVIYNKNQLQINNFNIKIEHNEGMDMIIKTESNKEKEEINILKKKNLDLIEENKQLCELIQELKYNISK